MTPSAAAYRRACTSYLHDVFEKPSLYFNSLSELEWQMIGHAQAYEELGYITRPECFPRCFMPWLWATHKISSSSGWGYALEKLAKTRNEKPEVLCAQLVTEFLADWS